MRTFGHLALIALIAAMSAPEALGQEAALKDVVIITSDETTTTASVQQPYEAFTLTAAGCCDQGLQATSTPAPGCCDQGWEYRSHIVSGRTLVAIAALAALLLAATFSHRFTFNKQSQWT